MLLTDLSRGSSSRVKASGPCVGLPVLPAKPATAEYALHRRGFGFALWGSRLALSIGG